MDDFDDLWSAILAKLPTEPPEPRDRIRLWTNGDEILGMSELRIEGIADLFDALGFVAHTGYYDPVEDNRNDQVDYNTGYYYVSLD